MVVAIDYPWAHRGPWEFLLVRVVIIRSKFLRLSRFSVGLWSFSRLGCNFMEAARDAVIYTRVVPLDSHGCFCMWDSSM